MTSDADRRATEADVLRLISTEAQRWLASLPGRAAAASDKDSVVRAFGGQLADAGIGDVGALEELIAGAETGLVATGGPRFFDLVCGGAAPAAVGADMLAAVWDPIASSVATSPLAVRLEEVALAWLRELFDLPPVRVS